ncbi:MAG: tRNA hydroxylase [Planctomycetia bacterium 21-64-5]|nr:MAG: tRNA hydroxylase [Planctomycetia bacterium 21-64-5]HQU44964.1 tRNA-(ms[2]io[6]A)-hydroxylase [Pirellulales bacterium]
MLNLKSRTSPQWLESVEKHIDEVLLDHAHCEKKAAGTAMNLIFAYVDRVELVKSLSPIVVEELDHFQRVIDLLASRGIRFRRLKPSNYAGQLAELVRKQEPRRAVDRLLVAALIEARSCERFALLKDRLSDRSLAAFYQDLFESEARHHASYVQLAKLFASEEQVACRLEELAEAEAEIIDRGDELPRMHS